MTTRALPFVERPSAESWGPLEIQIPVRMPAFSFLVDAVWLAVWAVVEVLLIAAFADRDLAPRPLLAAFLAVFTAAGAWIAVRLLWMAAGREEIRLLRNSLIFRREIAGLGRSRIVPLDAIRRVHLASFKEDPIYPSWGRPFVGKGPCYVLLDVEGEPFVLGRGMEEADARSLVASLRNHLRLRPSV